MPEVAPEADLAAVLALPEVVVDLARLPLLSQLAVPVPRQFLSQLEVPPLLEVVADRAVEAVSVEALHHHRSFSSAMAGS